MESDVVYTSRQQPERSSGASSGFGVGFSFSVSSISFSTDARRCASRPLAAASHAASSLVFASSTCCSSGERFSDTAARCPLAPMALPWSASAAATSNVLGPSHAAADAVGAFPAT
jgi:hypothetical protein